MAISKGDLCFVKMFFKVTCLGFRGRGVFHTYIFYFTHVWHQFFKEVSPQNASIWTEHAGVAIFFSKQKVLNSHVWNWANWPGQLLHHSTGFSLHSRGNNAVMIMPKMWENKVTKGGNRPRSNIKLLSVLWFCNWIREKLISTVRSQVLNMIPGPRKTR